MEFADPVVAQEELPNDGAQAESVQSNKQTQRVMKNLEGDIDAAYSSIESKFASLWSNASQSAQDLQAKVNLEEKKKDLLNQLNAAKQNINNNTIVQENILSIETQLKELGDHVKSFESVIDVKSISTQANKALDSLDSKLEIVEQQAGKFVSLFSSFFSNIVSIDNPKEESSGEPETLFSKPVIPGPAYSSSRFDNDLFKLHTTEAVFLESPRDEGNKLDINEKTEEISKLLEKYPDTLERLMNKLVPVEISYQDFWSRYFSEELKLKESEQKRKELLSKNEADDHSNNEHLSDDFDEEDFTWDDDDDEEGNGEEVSEDGKEDAKEDT